jgi:predicted translin family RNA/ssDNA-binding protein
MVQAKQMCSSTFMVIRRQRRVLWFCGALGNLSAALAKYNKLRFCAGIVEVVRGLYYSYVYYQYTNAVTQALNQKLSVMNSYVP